MGIPFKRVYRMRPEGDEDWLVVMGLTPLPGFKGLWMWQAVDSTPHRIVKGQVFVGEEQIVVVGEGTRFIFEPLTLENWEDMRDDVHDFARLRTMFKTDEGLQGWYWDEFAHNGNGDELPQSEIYRRLRA